MAEFDDFEVESFKDNDNIIDRRNLNTEKRELVSILNDIKNDTSKILLIIETEDNQRIEYLIQDRDYVDSKRKELIEQLSGFKKTKFDMWFKVFYTLIVSGASLLAGIWQGNSIPVREFIIKIFGNISSLP